MLRQEYQHLITNTERDRIVSLVTRVIDTLGSRDISIDDKHTPKLYSRFLSTMLARQQQAAKEARNRTRRPSPAKPLSGSGSGQQNNMQLAMQTQVSPEHSHQQLQAVAPVHNAGELLQPYEFSDAGTETTMERHDELAADEMLAGMHALDNPAWWSNVMMPGYTWQSETPVYAPSYGTGGVAYAAQQQQVPQQQMQQQVPQQQMPQLDLFSTGPYALQGAVGKMQ